MRDCKVNPIPGICEWATRITQLIEFTTYMPSKVLDKKSVLKELFDEMNHKDLLDAILPHTYCSRLLNMEWDVCEESYDETVDKLESIEPSIKVEALKDKEILELKEKVKRRQEKQARLRWC